MNPDALEPDDRGSLFVNADWSALVPAGSSEAAFGIAPEDAKRLGLVPLVKGDQFAQPEILSATVEPVVEPVVEEPAQAEPEVAAPAAEPEVAVVPEPEAKQAPKPADKKARKPANK